MAKKKKQKKTNPEKLESSIPKAGISKKDSSLIPIPTKVLGLVLVSYLIVSYFLYFQGIDYGYVLDDKIVLSENNYVKQGFAGIGEILTSDAFEGFLGEQTNLLQGGRYRPLSLVTFAIEYEIFGLNQSISHHINLLIYCLCGFFGFLTIRRLLEEKITDNNTAFLSLAYLSVLIFMVHPIHTEAVANIKGRDELMTFLFSMLSLYFSLKYIDTKKISYLISLPFVFFLGLLSKENTITFLAIIPFALFLFRSKDKGRIFLVSGALLTTVMIYLGFRYGIFGFILNADPSTDIMNNPFAQSTGMERLATVMYTSLLYLKLCIFPYPLTHDYYPFHIPILNFSDWRVILSLIVYSAIISAIFILWKKNKLISFCLGYFLASLSIVSNMFVNVGTFMNERFMFCASLGISILIVYLFKNISLIGKEKSKMIYLGLVGSVAIAFTLLTMNRVPVWESELALNRAAIKVSKNSARSNSFMSTALFNQFKVTTDPAIKQSLLAEAEPYANKALEIYPTYKNANIMKAGIVAEQYKFHNDVDRLLAEFKEILRHRPDVEYLTTYLKYLNTRVDKQKMVSYYIEVGRDMLMDQQKKYNWGIHYLILGNQLDPQDPAIKDALIEGYKAIDRKDLALPYFEYRDE